MSETLGDVRGDLSALPHGTGVSQDVLTRFINNRMQAMLAAFPWTRLAANTSLTVPAMYNTGTIAIVEGGTALTLTGGTFTAAMTGRRIRITLNREEFYTFTFVSGTTGTIERAYEGPTVTDAPFEIWKAVYELAAAVDLVQSIKVPRLGIDLNQRSQEWLDNHDASRRVSSLGPWWYAPFPDSAAGLPQVELYPGPEIAESLPVRYRTDLVRFGTDDTGVQFPNWVDTQVLFVGVEADLYGLHENLTMKQSKETDWAAGLQSMITADIQRMGPSQMRMADEWIQHRIERATGDSRRSSWSSDSRWGGVE